MPATSPPETSISSVFQPRASHQRRYMRSSISAQSCASVPPAPAWMSTNAFVASILPENMRWNSSLLILASSRVDVGDHRLDGVLVVRRPSAISSSSRPSARPAVSSSMPLTMVSSRARSRPSSCARAGSSQTVGTFQLAAYFFQTLALGGVVKDTP